MKHTQGPWVVKRLDDTFIVAENNEYILCIESNGIYKNMAANALLIAHAPEMLEMLQSLLENPLFSGNMPKTCLKVKELITKATTI